MNCNFLELRAALLRKGIDRKSLSQKLGISLLTVNLKFSNPKRDPWRLSEIYIIMDLLEEDYSKIHVYFPRLAAAA